MMERTDGVGNSTEDSYIPHPNHKAQESKAIQTLLIFSVLMVSLPFGAFFGTKYALYDYGVTGFANSVWSVSAAVIVVNLIIAVYVYIAFMEQEYDSEGNPIDDKPKTE